MEKTTIKLETKKLTLTPKDMYTIAMQFLILSSKDIAPEALDMYSKVKEMYTDEDIDTIAKGFVDEFWLADSNASVEMKVWKAVIKEHDKKLIKKHAEENKTADKPKKKKKADAEKVSDEQQPEPATTDENKEDNIPF